MEKDKCKDERVLVFDRRGHEQDVCCALSKSTLTAKVLRELLADIPDDTPVLHRGVDGYGWFCDYYTAYLEHGVIRKW